ncbi:MULTISPECIES: histidinol-phosphate transaminase [unclassified Microbacterium]|uniref:histidinol-phosphate transaminase n=1 Tax=unclassified Microbacterium TaxID=2609290 RepID=UPI0006F43C92|nr:MULTISPECIES: histidinol-phosphate transaminase [unclassified Microbacterium]AOX45999.1 aminotransferase [Microbacterium sp. BH-3-3-3]KQR88332.1 aminotransferase [Microbacterium sp. Leaf179]KQT75291.1 aminotransferase [Microbacterium sp. Leaf436]MBD8476992.1 histidinol-phosphate transaminase [Microbacterium sp. CFBP 8794]
MSDEPVLPRIRPEIAALPAYRQGRQASPDAFKLSSNENPFDPLPGVLEAIQGATGINRYPDATAARLRERLAARHGVSPDDVHVGAGSVSLLAQLLLATSGPGDEVVYAWRSFEAYPSLVAVAGATSVPVPLTADFRHDLPAMAAAVTDRTRLIIVCSPNNPTGPTVTHDEFAVFVDSVPADVLIVLDEAYAEFVTDPASVEGDRVRAIIARPNIVVLRTFSKAYGLAGLRVGYAIGHTRVLDAARSTAIPLSVTAAAEEAALASLRAESELLERVTVIAQRRDGLVARLREAGWPVPDAQGNFVWLPAGERAVEVAAAFEEAGLVVRPFAGDGVRISIGEEESLDRIVEAAASVAPR